MLVKPQVSIVLIRVLGSIFLCYVLIWLIVVCAFTLIIARLQTKRDRQQAEIALRESEAKYHKIAKNVPGMVYRYVLHTDSTDQFTFVSPHCQDLYELEAETMIGDSQGVWSLLHPEDLESVKTAIVQAIDHPQLLALEYRIITPSGRLKWIQMIAESHRQSNGDSIWDGVTIDISDRKQNEQLLANYNRLLEQQVNERTLALQQELAERKRAEGVANAVQLALRQANAELGRLATLDELTQIANRRRFDEHLSQEWRRLARDHQPLSLILCDVDYFKCYNDYYGHQGGDHCLQKIANAIARSVRRPADLATRYGGEEFAIILPNTNAEGAAAVAEMIRGAVKQLRQPHAASPVGRFVTLSLGISSMIPTRDQTPGCLIAQADEALYAAKKLGRDQACIS